MSTEARIALEEIEARAKAASTHVRRYSQAESDRVFLLAQVRALRERAEAAERESERRLEWLEALGIWRLRAETAEAELLTLRKTLGQRIEEDANDRLAISMRHHDELSALRKTLEEVTQERDVSRDELKRYKSIALCHRCSVIRDAVLDGEVVATIVYDREAGEMRIEQNPTPPPEPKP